MTEGALKLVRLTEGFYKSDVCPIDPRYNINFDDTSSMYSAGSAVIDST